MVRVLLLVLYGNNRLWLRMLVNVVVLEVDLLGYAQSCRRRLAFALPKVPQALLGWVMWGMCVDLQLVS